jgi:poly-gamma-glutamate synthesis protein (capsule biosynthesis protein)
MAHDIGEARRTADLVLASFHWGDPTRPSVLTDHEHRLARLAIEAGADAVFGHHHHVLRAIDVHRGRPIFYGLGNFVWDAPIGWAEGFSPGMRDRLNRLGKYAIRPRPGYPRLPFHPDGRMTVVSRCRIRDGEVVWFGFIPCAIRPDGLVEPLQLDSADGRRVLEFVREACDDHQLPVIIEPDPGERVAGFTAVRVTAAA